MAATLVQSSGARSGNGTSQSWTWATAPTVGNVIIVKAVGWASPTGPTASCADAASNSYTQRTNELSTGSGATTTRAAIFDCVIASSPSSTTVTWSVSSDHSVVFEEWSGLDTASLSDQVATPALSGLISGSGSRTLTVGPTGTLAQANELVQTLLGAATGLAASNIATPSGYTGGVFEQNSPSFIGMGSAYKTVAATTAVDATWQFDVSGGAGQTAVALLATYRIASAPPTITAQPTDQTVNNGATATFSVTATGTAPITYQWQDNSSGSFANIGGATSSSYAPTASYAMQGRQYRCLVSDAGGGPVTSSAATLRVAFNLSGTGPRAYSNLGAPFASGAVESYLRGQSGSSTVNALPGAWSWFGTSANFGVPQISATPGAWTWSASSQTFTQLVNATPGTWTWAGTTQATTQLINAAPGAWSWAGTTAGLTAVIPSTPGAWTWTGTTAEIPTLVNAQPGSWTWVGTAANFGGATVVNATPGAWSWAGTTAEIPTQVAATAGAWTWSGANVSLTQLVSAVPGAYSWAGTAQAFSQAIDAVPAAWTWAGSVQAIVSQVTLDASAGVWSWEGTRASLQSIEEPTGGGGHIYSPARAWRGESEEERRRRWLRDGLIPAPITKTAPAKDDGALTIARLEAETAAAIAALERFKAQARIEIQAEKSRNVREELDRRLAQEIYALQVIQQAYEEAVRLQIEENDIVYVMSMLAQA